MRFKNYITHRQYQRHHWLHPHLKIKGFFEVLINVLILKNIRKDKSQPQKWSMGLRILKLWGQGCQPYIKIAGAITFKGMRNVKGFFQNSFFDYEDGIEGNYVKGIPRDSYGSRNGERRGLVQVPRTRSIPLQIAIMWNTQTFLHVLVYLW